MRLQYFGTAAAEGWPAIFCNCANCERARAAGGRNIRTRSQALINDDLLIDFPADSYWHFTRDKIDVSRLSWVLFTHGHSDHFYPADLGMFRPPFGYREASLELMGNETVISGLAGVKKSMENVPPPHGRLAFTVLEKFKTITRGGYEITPLPADHDKSQNCFIYLVSDGEKRLLYANDTGFFPDETFEYLKGVPLDLVSLDCTYGLQFGNSSGHMSLDVCAAAAEKLRENGCGDARFIVNHFSHNGGAIYDEILAPAAEYDFGVSYDGCAVEI